MQTIDKLRQSLSMRTVGRATLLIVCVYAVLAVAYSVSFLNKVEASARLTQEQQIPLILSQNRNALKVERAASLIRSVYLAKDRRIERQIQLQLQTLCQSFTLDDNRTLIDGAREIAAKVKVIVLNREAVRQLRAKEQMDLSAEWRDKIKSAEVATTEAYQDAMHVAAALSESLATDAALVADNMATSIQKAVRNVKLGWIAILTLPVLFLIATLWVVKRHVMVPITSAIAGLESIGRPDSGPLILPTPVFKELATIVNAVGAYDAISQDLKRTNDMLQVLSNRDALTGLANRRTFETRIQTETAAAIAQHGDLSVLMIDLDHFKAVNDTHGHQAGDICLQAVARVLQNLDPGNGAITARYGGEEFVSILPGLDLEGARTFAERIRVSVSELVVTVSGHQIRLTASIGISSQRHRRVTGADLLAEADAALYQAKRDGRNRVAAADQSSSSGRRVINFA